MKEILYDKKIINFKEMCEIQDRLNEYTTTNWKNVLTPEHFYIAFFEELGEILGSGRKWKWWKKAGNLNAWNEKIEVVDCLHFLLSIRLLSPEPIEKQIPLGVLKEAYDGGHVFDENGDFHHKHLFEVVRGIVKTGNMNFNRINKLMCGFQLYEQELSGIYVAKATLNEIRQTLGYKEGSYIKTKEGVEDNERLQVIVDAFLSDKNLSLYDVYEMVKEEFLGERE